MYQNLPIMLSVIYMLASCNMLECPLFSSLSNFPCHMRLSTLCFYVCHMRLSTLHFLCRHGDSASLIYQTGSSYLTCKTIYRMRHAAWPCTSWGFGLFRLCSLANFRQSIIQVPSTWPTCAVAASLYDGMVKLKLTALHHYMMAW